MKEKILQIFILLTVWLFVFPGYAFASSISISSSQTSINAPDDEFVVNVNLSVSTSNGTVYYLRGEFYQQSVSSSCGFTWNGTGWYNGPYINNEWVNLLSISMQNNSWTGQIRTKIDPADSGCSASGDYNFRVQRYTSSGTASSDTETPLSVSVLIPTPSPSPTPTFTPTTPPSPSISPTQTISKAIYKINKPKDDTGSELTSVQIYIDDQYTHHVDDEILEFYPGNECYTGVSCDFGNHTISLRKNGYSDWEETRDFLAGINLEVNPVLNKQAAAFPTPSPTSTPTPSLAPLRTPTPTPVKTLAPSPLDTGNDSSGSGYLSDVLGIQDERTVLDSPVASGAGKTDDKFPTLAAGCIILGVSFIGFSIFSIIKSAKKSYTIESEKEDSQVS